MPMFISVCPLSLSYTHLPTHMSCRLGATCTDVQCCTNVDKIARSFHVQLNINPCDASLRVQIDKYYRDILLFDYTFGKFKNVFNV